MLLLADYDVNKHHILKPPEIQKKYYEKINYLLDLNIRIYSSISLF